MEKRHLPKLGIDVSLLGFGCMRLPTKDGKIDEELAAKMIDEAYNKGVTYFDTAFPYHNGESEPFLGKVLDRYPRDSYFLATKLPLWNVNSVEDADRIFHQQLERLHKDYVDFYLLHAINHERFEKMRDLGVIDYCNKLKEEGKIKYFGFSFHDSYEVFEEIITYREWDFCQIQYNYFDRDDQAGDRGYALAEKLGIPMVIMEPLKGGTLCNFSDDINAMFHEVDPTASIASFGLRWVANHPNVKVILSGMSSWEQVEDNLNTFINYKPFSKEDIDLIDRVDHTIRTRVQNGCTGCRYCMPCPAGVDIPHNFKVWNTYHMLQNYGQIKWGWDDLQNSKATAEACKKCGLCETKCPQKLSIRDDLARAFADLSNPQYK